MMATAAHPIILGLLHLVVQLIRDSTRIIIGSILMAILRICATTGDHNVSNGCGALVCLLLMILALLVKWPPAGPLTHRGTPWTPEHGWIFIYASTAQESPATSTGYLSQLLKLLLILWGDIFWASTCALSLKQTTSWRWTSEIILICTVSVSGCSLTCEWGFWWRLIFGTIDGASGCAKYSDYLLWHSWLEYFLFINFVDFRPFTAYFLMNN